MALGKVAKVERADAGAQEIDDIELHQLAHSADLTITAFAEHEAELLFAGAGDLGLAQLTAIEGEASTQQVELAFSNFPFDRDLILLGQDGVGADDRLGQHPVLRQYQQAARVLIEAAKGGQASIDVRDDWIVARSVLFPQGLAGQKARGWDLVGFGLGRDDADGLVENDAELRAQGPFGVAG